MTVSRALLAGLCLAAIGSPVLAATPKSSEQAKPSEKDWRTPAPETVMVIDTNKGRVLVELVPEVAPNHVARLQDLTRAGLYDGRTFFRVIDRFMAQTGDPTNTGEGGSDRPNLKAEFNAEPHVRGVCSMARSSSPDSANSQFFIVFDDATFLDNQYTVWGKVIEGMDNVDKIKRGEPVQSPDKMVSVKVAADAA